MFSVSKRTRHQQYFDFSHYDLMALPPKSTENIDIKTMKGNAYTNIVGSINATLTSQSYSISCLQTFAQKWQCWSGLIELHLWMELWVNVTNLNWTSVLGTSVLTHKKGLPAYCTGGLFWKAGTEQHQHLHHKPLWTYCISTIHLKYKATWSTAADATSTLGKLQDLC